MVEVGGGTTFLIVMPFLVLGVGIAYIVIAMGDERRRRKNRGVTKLWTRRDHPLRHIQIPTASTHKRVRDPEHKPERRRPPGPRKLKGL
jgi:hypothetical protein